ncbi:MAG: HAD-IIA family hydrolase [Anaerolineae bacterium]
MAQFDSRLFDGVRAVVLDGDGVLWRGSAPLPGISDFFGLLERLGIPFVLATNNSTRMVEDYVRKLEGLGIQAQPSNIVTSATATAAYLKATYGEDLAVHIVGEAGLHQILLEAGYANQMSRADVVVAGLDRDLTYEKVRRAAHFILNGAVFVGTNGDRTFPTPGGLAPGAGAVLAAIQTTCGREPIVIGKPQPTMFAMALRSLNVAPEEALMIGDRLDTDILGAQRAGLRTALVMCGVTDPETLAASKIQPDAVFKDLLEVATQWHEVRP